MANAIPIGTDFLPQYIDPTVSGNKAVTANFRATIYPKVSGAL